MSQSKKESNWFRGTILETSEPGYFGMIRTESGKEIFFSQSSYSFDWSQPIKVGDKVIFKAVLNKSIFRPVEIYQSNAMFR